MTPDDEDEAEKEEDSDGEEEVEEEQEEEEDMSSMEKAAGRHQSPVSPSSALGAFTDYSSSC